MDQCESRPCTIGRITLDAKQTGAPSAGNPHAGCDVAGTGNGFTVGLLRHSQRKRGETARLDLRHTAPVLDPTAMATRIHGPPSVEDRSCNGRLPGLKLIDASCGAGFACSTGQWGDTPRALGSAELPYSAPPDMISLLFYCLGAGLPRSPVSPFCPVSPV